MKFARYIGFGVFTFLLGLFIAFILGGLLGQSGSGAINATVFNIGIIALATSILFLCAIMVICTMMLINTIRDKKI
jgi:hypothetical protein